MWSIVMSFNRLLIGGYLALWRGRFLGNRHKNQVQNQRLLKHATSVQEHMIQFKLKDKDVDCTGIFVCSVLNRNVCRTCARDQDVPRCICDA